MCNINDALFIIYGTLFGFSFGNWLTLRVVKKDIKKLKGKGEHVKKT